MVSLKHRLYYGYPAILYFKKQMLEDRVKTLAILTIALQDSSPTLDILRDIYFSFNLVIEVIFIGSVYVGETSKMKSHPTILEVIVCMWLLLHNAVHNV